MVLWGALDSIQTHRIWAYLQATVGMLVLLQTMLLPSWKNKKVVKEEKNEPV